MVVAEAEEEVNDGKEGKRVHLTRERKKCDV